jgi:REP element-mobilizing transposase RayT
LKDYDYSQQGAYFVTICTQERLFFFGEIIETEMQLNEAGEMVQIIWDNLPERFPQLTLDAFVIRPNHVHGILVVNSEDPSDSTTAPKLGTIINAFKSITTHEYIKGVRESGWKAFPGKLWQRNYYEEIIRTPATLDKTREYIINNPAQ